MRNSTINDASNTLISPLTDTVVGKAAGTVGDSKLLDHNIYLGKVVEVDPLSRRLSVYVNDQLLHNCIYATDTLAALIGFANTQLPAIGQTVVCLYTSTLTWVIGSQPQHIKDVNTYSGTVAAPPNKYSQIGDKDFSRKYEDEELNIRQGYPMSRDLLQGEYEFSNNIGVALRLLTNFAQLDSGGLAKVECHLLNDMVRIVDAYYAHHNCGGDTLIWNNGRNNYEDHFTSYPHEAAGKLEEDQEYAEPASPWESQNISKIPEDASPISSTGRWRKSTYIGFLGDMIHYWVTQPVEVLSNYAQQAARASRFKTWVGSDGTLMVQAAGDIMIEVTQHMVIPEVNYKWDDPEYDPEKAMADLNDEYLKIWGEGEQHWQDIYVSCWQMRNYLKYITVWHSLQRFRQLQDSKFCTIKPEAENPVGNTDCGEKDKKEAGAHTDPKGAGHAIFHMSPGGSISVISGDSTSMIMDNGNIQLSTPNNIEIKAGGTFSVMAKDVSIKSYKFMEIASLTSSLTLKARTAFKALCEAGRMWLKSDAPNMSASSDLPIEFKKYSIVIDSSQGETLMHGAKGAVVGTTGAGGIVNIQSTGAGGQVQVFGSFIKMYGLNTVLLKSQLLGFAGQVSKFVGQILKIFNNMRVTNARVDINSVLKATYIGCPNTISAYSGFIDAELDRVMTTLEDDKLAAFCSVDVESESADIVGQDAQFLQTITTSSDYPKYEFKDSWWKFENWEGKIDNKSVLSYNSLKAEPFTEGMINETLKYDMDTVEFKNFGAPLSAPRTLTSSSMYPGKESMIFVFDKTDLIETLSEPCKEDFQLKDIAKMSDMKPKDLKYYFLKDKNK